LQRVLTTVTLLGLLVATAAAFAITEHLKLIKSPLAGLEVSKVLSPICDCATDKATIRVKLRHADRVTVTIVNSTHHTVATVASDVALPSKTPHPFFWNGYTGAGAVAPDGVYHPEVHLARARHTFHFTNPIVVDTEPPQVLGARAARAVLLVGPGESVAVRYVLSEPAHALVYLGRHRIIVSRRTRTHDKVKWAGTLGGVALPAGRYVLSIGARDLAGNQTPVAARKQVTVVVRYVELSPEHITVRSGRLFSVRVTTVAKRYRWRLGRRHGTRHGKLLRLRAPTTRGTYRLVVTENGHAQTAVVKVRRG
jgi:FlgD Ig-like domain